MKPENFRKAKDQIRMLFFGNKIEDSYNVKSLIMVDIPNDENFISKKAEKQQLPASLAKLFVNEYATTLTDLDDIVSVNYEVTSLTKQDSSVANIREKNYYIHNYLRQC